MLLRNRLDHMKGKAVLVNGHIYHIGPDAVICDEAGKHLDVPEADAQKLVSNPEAWIAHDPTQAPAPRAAAPSAERPRIQLVTNTGEVIPPPPKPTDQTKPDMGVGAVMAAQDTFEVKKQGEIPPPPSAKFQDPPIPAEGEDWADPSEDCSMGWLQACAKAYKIRYKGKDKAALVQKIKVAMYG